MSELDWKCPHADDVNRVVLQSARAIPHIEIETRWQPAHPGRSSDYRRESCPPACSPIRSFRRRRARTTAPTAARWSSARRSHAGDDSRCSRGVTERGRRDIVDDAADVDRQADCRSGRSSDRGAVPRFRRYILGTSRSAPRLAPPARSPSPAVRYLFAYHSPSIGVSALVSTPGGEHRFTHLVQRRMPRPG